MLEVLYVLRVTVSSGSLLPTDVHATLPLHIINFLSIDPPVSSPQIPSTSLDSIIEISRPIVADSERSEANLVEEPIADEDISYSDDDIQTDSEGLAEKGGHDLGNLSLHDDTDEVIQHAVASAGTYADYEENAPRFADLYYSSLQENLDRVAEQYARKATDNSQMTKSAGARGLGNSFPSRVHEKTLKRHSERQDQPQESYGRNTEAEADGLDTVHEGHHIRHSYHPSFSEQSEPRTAGPTCAPCGHHVALVTASSKLARCTPPQFGPRSSQFAESPSTHAEKQLPALRDVYNTSLVYGPDSTSNSTASRSRSVKDKIRELEERAERANVDA